MTETLKVLGQAIPTANTLTDLYTVPNSGQTSVSSIIICNQNGISQIKFRISCAVAGAADAPKQYVYYDMPLESNDTFIATVGISLNSGDIIRVLSNTDNVSFSIFGVEVF